MLYPGRDHRQGGEDILLDIFFRKPGLNICGKFRPVPKIDGPKEDNALLMRETFEKLYTSEMDCFEKERCNGVDDSTHLNAMKTIQHCALSVSAMSLLRSTFFIFCSLALCCSIIYPIFRLFLSFGKLLSWS